MKNIIDMYADALVQLMALLSVFALFRISFKVYGDILFEFIEATLS